MKRYLFIIVFFFFLMFISLIESKFDHNPTYDSSLPIIQGKLVPRTPISGHLFYGCKHRLTDCKIQCNTCKRFFCCKKCHDKIADHEMERAESKFVWCCRCMEVCKIGSHCPTCGTLFARYFCATCCLYDGTPFVSTFHCDKCMYFIEYVFLLNFET